MNVFTVGFDSASSSANPFVLYAGKDRVAARAILEAGAPGAARIELYLNPVIQGRRFFPDAGPRIIEDADEMEQISGDLAAALEIVEKAKEAAEASAAIIKAKDDEIACLSEQLRDFVRKIGEHERALKAAGDKAAGESKANEVEISRLKSELNDFAQKAKDQEKQQSSKDGAESPPEGLKLDLPSKSGK